MAIKVRADAFVSDSEEVSLSIGHGEDYVGVFACYLTAYVVVLEEWYSKLVHLIAFESREAWEAWEKRKAPLLRNYTVTIYEKGQKT